jgi:hypothetical protein
MIVVELCRSKRFFGLIRIKSARILGQDRIMHHYPRSSFLGRFRMAAQSLRERGGFTLGTQIWNAATLEKPTGKSFVANSPLHSFNVVYLPKTGLVLINAPGFENREAPERLPAGSCHIVTQGRTAESIAFLLFVLSAAWTGRSTRQPARRPALPVPRPATRDLGWNWRKVSLRG